MDDLTAAVIVQSPNFFGIVEQVKAAAEIAHTPRRAAGRGVHRGGVARDCWSRPRDADIVAGELQSFAISPSYGGPYAGIIATKEKFIRQMPGRLVGQTMDSRGNRAFCLTLSTREQHIRREKATSNICTNQALIALMATVFMTVYGKQGLRELAEQNLAKAHYLAGKADAALQRAVLQRVRGAAEGKTPEEINKALLKKKIIGGLPLGRFYPELADCMLLCATEMSQARTWTRSDSDRAAAERGGAGMIKKVRHHISQNEALLFERSSPGKKAYQLPELDVPRGRCRRSAGRGQRARARSKAFPEVSEVEAIRHFTRLSTWNYAIDLRHVPAGLLHHEVQPARSTKLVARTEGLAWAHPYQPEALSQGCMEVMARAGSGAGRDHRHGRRHAAARRRRARRADRHPADPRAARKARQPAQEDPDSRFGARHQSGHRRHRRLRGGEHQVQRAAACSTSARWSSIVNEDVAGADGDQSEHARRVRRRTSCRSPRSCTQKGAHALHGRRQHERAGRHRAARRFRRGRDAPQPAQDLLHAARRRRSGRGSGGGEEGARAVPARAAAEARRARSGPGTTSASTPSAACRRSTAISACWCARWPTSWRTAATDCATPRMDAVLNAIYIRKQLEPYFDLPYQAPNMHEVVFSDDRQAKLGVRTGDIAKRLIDYGFHPVHRQLPADRARRAHDRADRDRRQAGDRSVHRRHDLDRQGDRRPIRSS